MGLVYRAYDQLLEEEVAIKVLRTDLSANADAVRRFRGEIKLARKVSHPNVCRIHDYGEEGPLGYISMEILTGQDFQKTLKQQPNGLPEEEAVSAVMQIAAGLQAIHDVGILHRDLKTANASRDDRGVVRLVDFGIAKDLLSEGHTAAGQAFGTPEYMSPEQCRGEALDYRSDVYALGVVAFELFTGDVPIRGSTPMATLFKQIQEPPSFDTEPGSRVPPRYVPILKKALAKAAVNRFASALEFSEAIRIAAMEAPAAQTSAASATAAVSSRVTPVPPVAPTPPPPEPPRDHRTFKPGITKDARRDERIYLPTDVVLRKLGPDGKPMKEERTVAHDLSRSGMRILTSWSDLNKGDKVGVAEVGGDFATGAIVRNINRGTDHITRVGIEFLDKKAPDRLVGTDRTKRSQATPASSSPGVHASGGSGPAPHARSSGPRPTPPAADLRRPSGGTPPAGSRGAGSRPPSGPGATVSSARSSVSIQEDVETARKLVSESRIWEALECLARAQAKAEGTPEARTIRIMVAETQARNPALMRAAQHNLEDLARTEPGYVPVHAALGRIFREAGLPARARESFARVLALDPANQEATEALSALAAPTKRP